MKRLSEILCCAVVILAAGTTASLFVQSATARALMAYKEGVSSQQEDADRGACHEWAVQQTGFDPSAIYQAQSAGVDTKTILKVAGQLDVAASYQDPRWGSGGLGSARGTADVRRFNELYESYLTAGALCLQARGYTIAR
jgi:hypothetical protein